MTLSPPYTYSSCLVALFAKELHIRADVIPRVAIAVMAIKRFALDARASVHFL